MNVLPLFIDDWLSSPRIEAMDAEEERGFLHLLLRAAKNDAWLPNDPTLLALWSKLGPQWNRETHSRRYRRYGVTSGQKILACFEERNGRLYNARLTECFEKWKKNQSQRVRAIEARWNASRDDNSIDSNKAPIRTNIRADIRNGYENDTSHTHTHTHTQEAVSTLVVSPVPVAERILENRENHTPETTVTIVEPPAREAQVMRAQPTALPDFERWWGGWSQIRGTNHRQQAFSTWVSTVRQAHLPDVYACTQSYLSSLENPAKGYNPENFLADQSRDGFKARWPPKRGSPGEDRRREAARKFQERMREEIENGQRKIQSA